MTWLKAFLYACLALFLTGCFTSDDPLISRDGEDFPVAAGRYTALQLGDVEEDLFSWNGELAYRDGRIWSATPDAPLEHGVFRHLYDNFYAVMDASEEDSYLYLLVWTYPDGGVGLHLPTCGHLSADSLDALGFDLDGANCRFTSWEQLREGMEFYIDDRDGDLRPDVVLLPAG